VRKEDLHLPRRHGKHLLMDAVLGAGGSRRVATAAGIAAAVGLGIAGFALAPGVNGARGAALPAFVLAALVGIARTTTA
jgi:hypothetical protein